LRRYKALVDQRMSDLGITLREIAGRAPNAEIILMGYPEIFSRTVKFAGSWYWDSTETERIAELGKYVNDNEKALTDDLRQSFGIRVDHADPTAEFVGHAICDGDEWFNGVVIGPHGDGDIHAEDDSAPALCFWDAFSACLSRESLHPNTGGAAAYADVMRKKLIAIGYNRNP
jgi:hypothetical protein